MRAISKKSDADLEVLKSKMLDIIYLGLRAAATRCSAA